MSNDTFKLSGRIVAITGGYGHLGKSITEGLLDHGAIVWVLGRSQVKYNQAFIQKGKSRERLFFSCCDISKTSSIQNSFEMISNVSGGMDVLINNAFYLNGGDSILVDDHVWEIGIDGILSNVYRCIRESIPYLRKSRTPKIINVSSAHGMLAPEKEMLKPPQYGVSKAGVIQLTKYFASYLGPDNINVNTITPGPFPSDKGQKNQEYIKKLKSKTCLNRIGQPEELIGAFVFLSSNASNYVTGHNLVVDGGFTNS